MDLREQMINAMRLHAEAEIELHKTNVEIYMQKVVGIGEHSDIIETIQKELDAMASADDRLEMLNKYFRVIVGVMVLLSVALTYFVHQNWMWFAVFIGVNLIQSAFTKWCLLETILMKLGIKK